MFCTIFLFQCFNDSLLEMMKNVTDLAHTETEKSKHSFFFLFVCLSVFLHILRIHIPSLNVCA